MSIEPPSDIVLDVASAADPARRAEAANRLVRLAGDGEGFAPTLADVADPPAGAGKPAERSKAASSEAAKAYREFEGMVLATFVESAFPESATAFGAGTAGSVWRSMFAQEIGAEMAGSGGIGIADSLAASSLLTRTAERGFLAALKPTADDTKT